MYIRPSPSNGAPYRRDAKKKDQLTDEKFANALSIVGHACFVQYFEYFSSPTLCREDIIQKLKSETMYPESACARRTDYALKIINAGFAKRALNIIVRSNISSVSRSAKEKAEALLGAMS